MDSNLPTEEIHTQGGAVGETPLKIIEGKTFDEIVAEMEVEQQRAYEARVDHARTQGDLMEYRETVLWNVPYAWVRWDTDKLTLLPLKGEGVTRRT